MSVVVALGYDVDDIRKALNDTKSNRQISSYEMMEKIFEMQRKNGHSLFCKRC